MTNLAVPNWSFSKLVVYESCPYRFKLSAIDKMPEPPRPPDNPLERGNRIHAHIEGFIKGEIPSLKGCEARGIDAFVPMITHARDLYTEGKASVEENWLFDQDWMVCDRDIVWLWMKLDLNVEDKPNAVSIVDDWKSGKSAYKAIDHVQQMQLYAAAAAIRQPWAETIIVELSYVDEGHVKQQTYTREQALMFVGRFDMRAKRIYADKHFRPNPNAVTCRYCPYGPRGTGICPVGV
jgi:CRISPR/Cas system-associated exonuclease Cas4 (RecB family)